MRKKLTETERQAVQEFYEDRQKADYKRFKFSKEEAEKRFNEAQTFIKRIEELLKKEGFLVDFKSLS